MARNHYEECLNQIHKEATTGIGIALSKLTLAEMQEVQKSPNLQVLMQLENYNINILKYFAQNINAQNLENTEVTFPQFLSYCKSLGILHNLSEMHLNSIIMRVIEQPVSETKVPGYYNFEGFKIVIDSLRKEFGAAKIADVLWVNSNPFFEAYHNAYQRNDGGDDKILEEILYALPRSKALQRINDSAKSDTDKLLPGFHSVQKMFNLFKNLPDYSNEQRYKNLDLLSHNKKFEECQDFVKYYDNLSSQSKQKITSTVAGKAWGNFIINNFPELTELYQRVPQDKSYSDSKPGLYNLPTELQGKIFQFVRIRDIEQSTDNFHSGHDVCDAAEATGLHTNIDDTIAS